MKSKFLFYILVCTVLAFLSCAEKERSNHRSQSPNFLFCIADDWSFPHAGIYGDAVIRTPNFDRIAREGILFTKAYTAAPSCSPSRASILTGQDIYRLEAGGCLFGTLPKKFPVYTQILEKTGYAVASTGKGYDPADLSLEDWEHNPAGLPIQEREMEVPNYIRSTDYAANFADFLNARDTNQPFCFWYGASEPHRPYHYGIGASHHYNLADIKVPEFLPDTDTIRNDVADYYYEVEWFDRHLGRMIKVLEQRGELENTVILVTSDNGMPFPRAKANLYDYGTRMPLAIRWGNKVQPGQICELPVSLIDIAPSILEMAQVGIPEAMTGISLVPLLANSGSSLGRDFVVTALERHTLARPDQKGYPMRGIHTKDFTYIHNFAPERWPQGDPDIDAWPQGFYGDIDDGASKSQFENDPDRWPDLFSASFGKRPAEELFEEANDPFQMQNLADDPAYEEIKKRLKEKLFDYLDETEDPRHIGLSPWDHYHFSGGADWY
ncbi:MAG: sulfatase [Saprospiraceae bacterium]|nr:sulfatase [Saprospiraceae bacterium]